MKSENKMRKRQYDETTKVLLNIPNEEPECEDL
jgi:hypothetical protein